LDRENVGQFSIVSVGPEMRVGQRVDELNVYANLIAGFLYAAFQNVRYAEALCDLAQVFGGAFEMLGRCTRDDFQVGNFGQARQDFILHTFTKVSVIGIATEIVEWQNGDGFVRNCSRLALSRRGCRFRAQELIHEQSRSDDSKRDRY